MECSQVSSRLVIFVNLFVLKIKLNSAIRYPNCVCVIYTGDKVKSEDEFINKANERFTIQLSPSRTRFVYLRFRFLVLDKYYPVFTILGNQKLKFILIIFHLSIHNIRSKSWIYVVRS